MSSGNSSTILVACRNTTKYRAAKALVAALSLAAAQPARAQTTNPNVPPTPPPSVVTSVPALSAVGAGGCKQQYTGAINNFAEQANTAGDVAAASAVTAAAANAANVTAQTIAGGTSSGAFTALAVGLGGMVAYGTSPLPNAEVIPS